MSWTSTGAYGMFGGGQSATIPFGFSSTGWAAACWARTNTVATGYQTWVSKQNSADTTRPFWLGQAADTGAVGGVNNAILVLSDTAGTAPFAHTSSAISTGNWYFSVASKDPNKTTVDLWAWSLADGTGNLVPMTTATGGTGTGHSDSGSTGSVTYFSVQGGLGFNGTLKYGAVWMGPLTAAEAAALSVGASPFNIRPSKLYSYVEFDDFTTGVASTRGTIVDMGLMGGACILGTSGAATFSYSGLQPRLARASGLSKSAARIFLNPFQGPFGPISSNNSSKWPPFQLKAA